ncbi:MAG: phosphoglycolate phosphatase [Alphaproteobacteria bacterium]
MTEPTAEPLAGRPQPIRALVLDLDGTLIDSAPDLHAAVAKLLGEEGLDPPGLMAVTAMIGDGMAKLVERAFAAVGRPVERDALPALVQRFRVHYEGPGRTRLTRVYPDVPETLALLRGRGVRLGVCTNKAEAAAVSILAELGLADLLDAVVGGDTAPAQKPDPAHVHATIARMGADPAFTAMVGDSPNDVAAGLAAGLPVVAVAWGYTTVSPDRLGAAVVLRRFGELPGALDRLRGHAAGTVRRAD